VAGRRPTRPRVSEYSARCPIQIVRTNQRGTFGGAFWVVSVAVAILGLLLSTV
jgi:hypothetical protein